MLSLNHLFKVIIKQQFFLFHELFFVSHSDITQRQKRFILLVNLLFVFFFYFDI